MVKLVLCTNISDVWFKMITYINEIQFVWNTSEIVNEGSSWWTEIFMCANTCWNRQLYVLFLERFYAKINIRPLFTPMILSLGLSCCYHGNLNLVANFDCSVHVRCFYAAKLEVSSVSSPKGRVCPQASSLRTSRPSAYRGRSSLLWESMWQGWPWARPVEFHFWTRWPRTGSVSAHAVSWLRCRSWCARARCWWWRQWESEERKTEMNVKRMIDGMAHSFMAQSWSVSVISPSMPSHRGGNTSRERAELFRLEAEKTWRTWWRRP